MGNRSDYNQSQPGRRLSQVQSKITTARKNLQHGYYATKYSKDGFFPHDKKVFLSLDGKKLCWAEKDKLSDYKSIPIEVIIQVEYAHAGDGLMKHVDKLDVYFCCVITYYTGDQYKKKTIELKGESPHEMKQFVEELKIIIDYSKGVSLNALT